MAPREVEPARNFRRVEDMKAGIMGTLLESYRRSEGTSRDDFASGFS